MDQPLTSIPTLVSQRAASHGSETILRTKDRGIWKTVTWSQLADQGPRDRRRRCWRRISPVAMSWRSCRKPRPEAVYADLAILGCGAASVAIDPDDEPDRVCHLLSSSGCRLAFVENEEQLDKLLTIRDRCPALSRIVVFDMKGLRDFADAGCISLSAFVETGGAADWTAAVRAIEADQPAVIQFSARRRLRHGPDADPWRS